MTEDYSSSSSIGSSEMMCQAIGCTNACSKTKCSRCKAVYYCTKDCARDHWSRHKRECEGPVRNSRRALGVGPGPVNHNRDIEDISEEEYRLLNMAQMAMR